MTAGLCVALGLLLTLSVLRTRWHLIVCDVACFRLTLGCSDLILVMNLVCYTLRICRATVRLIGLIFGL